MFFLLSHRQQLDAQKGEEDGVETDMQEAFMKTLAYAERFGQFGTLEKVREVRA